MVGGVQIKTSRQQPISLPSSFSQKHLFKKLLFVKWRECCDVIHFSFSVQKYYKYRVKIKREYNILLLIKKLAALAQMVACLPLIQRVRGSIPGEVVNFHLKIFNLGARRGGDVHFLIAILYITGLD